MITKTQIWLAAIDVIPHGHGHYESSTYAFKQTVICLLKESNWPNLNPCIC